ncbi:ABC-2 type transport system permease protein/lipopolysaccharide transport system permease protein [Geodermatophilus aquaeductus]|uniref:Transport permease protein n=1 Tax=Geodermatophilus aquaeductus TaxID=1564161 RepID=A0A521FQQ6_9ACTN|nr:ABC transporter permease [Geodermatophilus aquaeductus]SMO98528.1 ABC-2 type transport system permease protein/lipopolysaccharide transport system permease protein [Geodermatophilus aquaeductus]
MPEADTHTDWVENSASGSTNRGLLGTLWESRELVGFLALKDLKIRYKQAALGFLWVAAQPLATVAVFTLVFDRLGQVDSGDLPYPVFALAGLVSWTYVSYVVTQGSQVLVENASLVTKVYFPRIAAPASTLLPPLADMAVAAGLLLVLAIAYGVPPTWHLVLVPAWLLLLASIALGMCLWLSAINVRYRDVKHALGPLVQLWLFASPVAYSGQGLDGVAGWAYALNPMVGTIELGRWVLVGAPLDGRDVAMAAIIAVVLLVTGSRYFLRAERSFADVV